MRDPVITISFPGPFAALPGSAAGAWPAITLGGGSVLCPAAAVPMVASAAKATPARSAGSIRFIDSPLFSYEAVFEENGSTGRAQFEEVECRLANIFLHN
jgi:hypothetical protein